VLFGSRRCPTNRTDIVKAMANNGVMEPEKALTAVLEVISLSLACGETIHLRGFGRLTPRLRPAMVRKHPRTAEEVVVPMTHSVSFVLSDQLKRRLNLHN
jgi:DNA-binding protein HU-beta